MYLGDGFFLDFLEWRQDFWVHVQGCEEQQVQSLCHWPFCPGGLRCAPLLPSPQPFQQLFLSQDASIGGGKILSPRGGSLPEAANGWFAISKLFFFQALSHSACKGRRSVLLKSHFNPAIFPKSQICMFRNIWESDS